MDRLQPTRLAATAFGQSQPKAQRRPRRRLGIVLAASAVTALCAWRLPHAPGFASPSPAAAAQEVGTVSRGAALRPALAASLGLFLNPGRGVAEEGGAAVAPTSALPTPMGGKQEAGEFVMPRLAVPSPMDILNQATGAEKQGEFKNDGIPKVGEQAPDFELTADNGDKVKLSALTAQKKKVVLVFNRGLGEFVLLKNFQYELRKFRDLGAEVVGISTVSAEKLAEFKEVQKISFQFLADDGGKVGQKYGVARAQGPVFGTNDLCVTFVVGLDGKIEQYWPYLEVRDTTGKHARDVLQRMNPGEAFAPTEPLPKKKAIEERLRQVPVPETAPAPPTEPLPKKKDA